MKRKPLVAVLSVLIALLGVLLILLLNTRTSTTISSHFEPSEDVLTSFSQLASVINKVSDVDLDESQRTSLISKLDSAASAYKSQRICEALHSVNAYLRDVGSMRNEARVGLMERFYNRGRALRDSMFDLFVGKPEVTPPQCFDPASRKEPQLTIQASDNQHFAAEIRFGTPRLWTVQAGKEIWTQMELPGVMAVSGVPGLPSVPFWRTLVAVPEGAKAILKVAGEPIVAEILQVNLYPYQSEPADQGLVPIAPEFADPPFVKDEKFYTRDGTYPSEPCMLQPLGNYRDLQVAQVLCAAGQYNPVTDQLKLFKSIQFDVTFDGGDANFITNQTISPFEPAGDHVINSVVNRKAVAKYVGAVELSHRQCIGEELLILTHPLFRDAANDLAEWKREKGIVTTIIDVGAETSYESADDIDDLIEGRYEKCQIRPSYVLLLGDAEFVPPARTDYDTRGDYCGVCGDESTGSDWDYAIYPIYPFENMLADFGVSRIPVDTAVEAQTVVDKVIEYESSPPRIDYGTGEPFYTTAAFAAQFQCCRKEDDGSPLDDQTGRAQRSFTETAEVARNTLIAAGKTGQRIYVETIDSGYSGDTEPNRYRNGTLLPADLRPGSGFAWNGSTQDIANAFNDGRFLVLHRDHGGRTGFAHPSFRIHNLDLLSNNALLPVVYSVNCKSGYFDHETDVDNSEAAESFMEALLFETDGGMVGGLGDVRNSPTWANSALTRGFFDATWPDLAPEFGAAVSKRRLADILNHGRAYMLTQVGVPQTAGSVVLEAARAENIMWHAFGDPTLEMWTDNPYRFPLNLKHKLSAQRDHLRVEYGEEGATITALQRSADGKLIPIGRAVVKNGAAAIPYFNEPEPNQPILLSASKENAVSVLLTAKRSRPDLPIQE